MTKYNAIPISVNKVIQTGPKTQFGGVNEGLFIESYHVPIDGVVKIEPIEPMTMHKTINPRNFTLLLTLMLKLNQQNLI